MTSISAPSQERPSLDPLQSRRTSGRLAGKVVNERDPSPILADDEVETILQSKRRRTGNAETDPLAMDEDHMHPVAALRLGSTRFNEATGTLPGETPYTGTTTYTTSP